MPTARGPICCCGMGSFRSVVRAAARLAVGDAVGDIGANGVLQLDRWKAMLSYPSLERGPICFTCVKMPFQATSLEGDAVLGKQLAGHG